MAEVVVVELTVEEELVEVVLVMVVMVVLVVLAAVPSYFHCKL